MPIDAVDRLRSNGDPVVLGAAERLNALRRFGYTESEARFLYIVAIHSGYFTQRHFCQFTGAKTGCVPTRFTVKITKKKHAKKRDYQNNAQVFHLTHKAIYRAIGKENIRNRRAHSFEFVITRLAILDFVLSHLQHRYFEDEFDKVQYFQEQLQIPPQQMPGRTYAGANRAPRTVRCFVDKFPLFLDSKASASPLLTLTYIDPGLKNLSGFRTHLRAYSTFLSRLLRFAFLFASPDASLFSRAERVFAQEIAPGADKFCAQVARYFRLRSAWEGKLYELLTDNDLEFLHHARSVFVGEPLDSLYTKWEAGELLDKDLSDKLERVANRRQEIYFRTFTLPRDYSRFGQNSQFAREPS